MAAIRGNDRAVDAINRMSRRFLDQIFDTGNELTEILGTGRMDDFDELLLAAMLTVWTSVIHGSAGLTRVQANTRLTLVLPRVVATLRSLEKANQRGEKVPMMAEKEKEG